MSEIVLGGSEEPQTGGPKVGYASPPQDTQFKKGLSGNPKGRPKRPKGFKSVSRLLRDYLLEEIVVSVSGKSRKMTRMEAVSLRQAVRSAG